jgi:magnesium chelatase family protein
MMVGSPGAGKTLLARALPGILPEMSIDESLDVTKIYSIADQLPPGTPLIRHRPFRAPHHTISHAGLVGGGNIPHPGEISLAHRGSCSWMSSLNSGQESLKSCGSPWRTRS